MSERNMLFAVRSIPEKGQAGRELIGLTEVAYCVPEIYKLLVSENTQACISLVFDHDEPMAIVGDAAKGLAKLKDLSARLDIDAPAKAPIEEAIAFLTRDYLDYPYFIMEPGEIFGLEDKPYTEQLEEVLGEIDALDMNELVALGQKSDSYEHWATDCWSHVLYFTPMGAVDPPLDITKNYVYTTLKHLQDNAERLPHADGLEDITIDFDSLEELEMCAPILARKPGNLNLKLRGPLGELKAIPLSIACLPHLKGLDVSQSGLTDLPLAANAFISIERLLIGKNEFDKFPEAIRGMKRLKVLRISDNYIDDIPPWIGDLKALENLYLNDCELETLPEPLWQLTQLKRLDLAGNERLTTLGKGISRLKNLKHLNISRCNLRSLPSELTKLEKLEKVFAMKNQLQNIPFRLRMKKLDTLNLADNPLKQQIGGYRAKNLTL